MELGEAFDGRPNALNSLRLALAATVIVWHGLVFRGELSHLPNPLNQLMGEGAVDAFFVISGFLIVRSWERQPRVRAFARARASRLLPGLWVCLIVTAFALAPLADAHLHLPDQLRYVWGNAFLYNTQQTISGTPALRVSQWNSSLWTLFWEGLCYAAVAVLGRSGWLRPLPVATFALCAWGVLTAWWLTGQWPGVSLTMEVALPRLGLDFALGALLWLLRDRVRFSPRLAAVAAVLLICSLFLATYHPLGALPLAYLCLWGGVELGRFRVLRWRHDLSYGAYIYGAPVQQSMLLMGMTGLAWWQFGMVSWLLVAPFAAASWFLVERPVLRRTRRDPGVTVTAADPLPVQA